MDLFSYRPPPAAPLAERMRPGVPSDIVGQEHLLGPGKPLEVVFRTKAPHSMIFQGPPGVGKTTLANITAKAFSCAFVSLSAVFSGVKEIRAAAEEAKIHASRGKRTILFVDEIHRFNKAQQDALLPYTENGLFILIGATTENPSFEVNSALLSRARLYVLRALNDEAQRELLRRALIQAAADLSLTESAAKRLIEHADGDARRLLNALEHCIHAARADDLDVLDDALLARCADERTKNFDKGGDAFYDRISALHKSIRGSSPDGALYWLCAMLEGGADPRYIARRLIRIAWEDIGLADPRAMEITEHAAACYERLGSPEGELALGQAALYLACAPKSNAGYNAYKAARAFVAQDRSRDVPLHLRNAPTALMKAQGFGRDYRYAHNEPHAYAAGERYLPEHMPEPEWYKPVERGLELKIKEKLVFLRELDDKRPKKS